MAIVFFLILAADKYEQPESKYRNDLEKQRREKEEQRKIYADRDNADGQWWTSNSVYPRKPEKPEIKEVEDIQKIRLKMEDLIEDIFK